MLDHTISTPLYFVECNFARNGNAFLELDRDRNSRKNIVNEIASGEIENVLTILEVVEAEGTCREVTEDIAREVMEAIDQQEPVPGFLRDFLDNHLGASTCDRFDSDLSLEQRHFTRHIRSFAGAR